MTKFSWPLDDRIRASARGRERLDHRVVKRAWLRTATASIVNRRVLYSEIGAW